MVGSVLLIFFSFLCCVMCSMLSVSLEFAPVLNTGVHVVRFLLFCVFTFLVPCCDVRYDFRIKWCPVRRYHSLLYLSMSYLCYLCLCAYCGVKYLTIWAIWRVSYRRQELFTPREQMGSLLFFFKWSSCCSSFFQVCLRPVSCVPNVASFSGRVIKHNHWLNFQKHRLICQRHR